MNSRYRLPLFILALAALAAAFAFSAPLQAQEGTEYEYVDLVMLYRQDPEGSNNARDVAYTVLNLGTATATGVTVEFLLEDLEASDTFDTPNVTDQRTVDSTDQKFTYVIGTLLPGESSQSLIFSTKLHSGRASEVDPNWPGRIGVINATASANQPEPGILSANNVIKVYSFADDSAGQTEHMLSNNRLALRLSVDDLEPAAGDDLNFDLTATKVEGAGTGFINLIGDIEIKVELSEGLQFKSTTDWTRPTGFVTSGRSATWQPGAVAGDSSADRPQSREIEIQTELTSDSLDDIPLEERCITARVADSTPPPAADYALGSFTQCLGDDPPVLLEEGAVAVLTSFPCIDDTHTDAHQCESVPGVAVAGRLPSRHPDYEESNNFYANLRSHGVGRTDEHISGYQGTVFLDPESVVIQVKDPEGRVQDSHDHSVSAVSWQTARKAIDMKNRAVDGVTITYTRKDIKDASAWNSLGPRILTVTRADGTTPGKVKIRLNSSGNQFFDLSSGTATRNAFNITSVSTSVVAYFAEFETLGTYLIDYSLTLTDSDSNAHTDSGTYTFHVGPVAELEVRDGGANPGVASTQRAFTIVAVNNGPDDAPEAEVTVTGLDATTCTGTATKGSLAFASGECTWTIGELIAKEASQIQNGRDGEILTIITTAAVDSEITAEIENTQDYQVCIDSDGDDVGLSSPSSSACTTEDSANTWHTAKYYDYNDDTDSATIKAKDGTGADLPSVMTPESMSAAIVISWSPVSDVSGREVTHYEVQRETNPWETVADDVTGTKYVDTDVEDGDTFRYRVRAVNDWDHKGPWSAPMEGSVAEVPLPPPPPRTTVPEIEPPGVPTGMQAMPLGATELLVFWSTPAESIVDHYQLQVSEDDGATWDDLDASLMANSYNHTGLQEGDTRHYRVRAWNTDDPQEEGPWSATVGATTDDSEAAEPPPPVVTPRPSRDDDDDDDYAHFATLTTTRSVVENSAAGSPVGNPVVAVANRGNRVTYSLEGDDAQHFDIEPDSGQILVGEDLILDHEGGPNSYSVVVVADPRRGSTDRITVTITVIDAPETASLAMSPEGLPQVGQELAAAIEHSDGPEVEMVVVSWQWQRSADGLAWTVIEGADDSTYTPTDADAGYRLRVIVTYSPPGSDGLVLTGLVTQPLPGELASPEASETPETIIPAPTGTGTAGDGNAGAVSLILLPATGPQVGEPLAAVLSEDGAPSWSSWQWQRSLDGVTWQDIQGAVADHYYPTDADAGHLLRVIYTYIPAGSVNPMLVGALTERLPGDPPQPPPASLHQQDPTPTPVAAATPVPAPVPTPVPALAPTTAPTAEPEPAATATPAPLLVTASSLASRGVGIGGSMGDNQPASEEAGEAATPAQATGSPLASQGDNVTPPEHPMAVEPPPPSPGAEPAAQEGGRETLVWVVLAVFAALVASSGSVYYYLRMRRP